MKEVISVIVPIFRVEDYLLPCIESIVNQTYQKLDIILVDDGSPDGCPKICDEWAKKDERIRVIHKENGGLSQARNVGLDVAKGDYIVFVDSDDWIEECMIETMLHIMKKEQADVCACGVLDHLMDGTTNKRCQPYQVGSASDMLKLLYEQSKYPVSAWNKLYKKKCWETLRFPEGKLCEDTFTTYLILHNAKKNVQIPHCLYHYRIRQQSIMTMKFRKERMDEEEAWRKNYEFMEQHYPQHKQSAYEFYLQKVHLLLKSIPKENRKEFQQEYKTLRTILWKRLGYMMCQSKFPMKYRVKFLLEFMKG